MQILANPSSTARGDFLVLQCSGIPLSGVRVVVRSGSNDRALVPNLLRPHLVFIATLPDDLPIGPCSIRIEANGATSNAVPANVIAGPAPAVTVLNPGANKPAPFTLAFVANPAVELQSGGTFVADPILTSRATFNNTVSFCLRTLFSYRDDLLYAGGIDAQMRLVAIFDATRPPIVGNALVHEDNPAEGLMETRRIAVAPFLANYSVSGSPLAADVVFVIHNWSARPRATAWPTTDDEAKPSVPFNYDGTTGSHGTHTRIPGSVALYAWEGTNMVSGISRFGITPFHEFGHAASAFQNGIVTDLYVDQEVPAPDRIINKKSRAAASQPIPMDFAEYRGEAFFSDQDPQGAIPFTSGSADDRRLWLSYRPNRLDARPAVMDNYWFVNDPENCRHDALTRAYLADRIRVKLDR